MSKHRRHRLREIDKLLDEAAHQGWTLVPTKSGYRLLSPDGVTTTACHLSKSNDPRAYRNLRADLRRGGVQL